MAVGGTGSQGSKHPVKIFANIFISFIGAGVLGLPFAFKEAGVLEGIFVMTVVGIISVKAMLLLIDCKYKLISEYRLPRREKAKVESSPKKSHHEEEAEAHEDGLLSLKGAKQEIVNLITEEEVNREEDPGHDLSYGDVGYYAIGKYGRGLVEIAIVVSQIGFCCAYLIFITENLSDYINSMKLVHWLIILLPPLSILTLLRHLGSLALTSLMAQCSNLLAFGVVFWFDFEHFSHVQIHPKKMSIVGLPFFICIAIYCYEGAGMILSLESSLAKEVRHKFKSYFIFTMCLVTFLYISFGSAGYLSFGPETNAIITLNLPKGESLDFAVIVKSLLCLALFFTYPVMMFPVVKILESYFMSSPEKKIWRGNVLRILMVLMTGLVVIVIPNFANLMALVGATCCTMLAFVLPGLFHMSIFKGSLTIYQVILDWSLMFVGVVGAIIGTIDAFKRMGNTTQSNVLVIPQNITQTVGSVISHIAKNLTETQ